MSEFGKWIDIKDKEPEDRQRCIFWDPEYRQASTGIFYSNADGNFDVGPYFDGEIFSSEATHWMPEPGGPDD